MGSVENIWNFAGVTAMVGMGVVFAALFLLSVYMHYFKSLIARLEQARSQEPQPRPATPVPPAAAAERPAADEAAAAIGLALHLVRSHGEPSPETAAAIAVALSLQTRRSPGEGQQLPVERATSWGLAGRMATMTDRVARQRRTSR